jgi:hypothetical protein
MVARSWEWNLETSGARRNSGFPLNELEAAMITKGEVNLVTYGR